MKEKEENEASWETRFITLKNMEKWKGKNGKMDLSLPWTCFNHR